MVSLPSVNNKKCIKTMITKEDTTLNQNTEPHLVHIRDVHLDDDIYARLKLENEFYTVLAGAQREIRHFFVEGGAGFCIE